MGPSPKVWYEKISSHRMCDADFQIYSRSINPLHLRRVFWSTRLSVIGTRFALPFQRSHAPSLRILEFCHTSFTRINMRLIRTAVAAAAVLLSSCASSVHATLAFDKENCKTLELGRFLASNFRVAGCVRDCVSFHHGNPPFTHTWRRHDPGNTRSRTARAKRSHASRYSFANNPIHLCNETFSTPSPAFL